ncbi:MAG: hypothetical protein ACREQQ_12280 [Candidatus Binatia bacterium]
MRRSNLFLALSLMGAVGAGGAWAQLPPLPIPIPTPPGGGGDGGPQSVCCSAVPCVQDDDGDCTNPNGGWACNETVIIAIDPGNPGPPTPPSPPAGPGGCVELVDIAGITDGLNGVLCVGGGADPASQAGGACACIGPLCGSGSGVPPTPDQTVEGCTANAVIGCRAAGAANCQNPDGDCGP